MPERSRIGLEISRLLVKFRFLPRFCCLASMEHRGNFAGMELTWEAIGIWILVMTILRGRMAFQFLTARPLNHRDEPILAALRWPRNWRLRILPGRPPPASFQPTIFAHISRFQLRPTMSLL